VASVSRAELHSCRRFGACFRKQLGRAINGRRAENWGRVRSPGENSTSNRLPGNRQRRNPLCQLDDGSSALEVESHRFYVRFEVFTAVTMKNVVFWDLKTQFVRHGRHIAVSFKEGDIKPSSYLTGDTLPLR
jgi:hypothetical protein